MIQRVTFYIETRIPEEVFGELLDESGVANFLKEATDGDVAIVVSSDVVWTDRTEMGVFHGLPGLGLG